MYITDFIASPEILSISKDILNTPFVQEMKNGTLPDGLFRYYLTQDHIYLKYYKDAGKKIKLSSDDSEIKELYGEIGDEEPEFHTRMLKSFNLRSSEINDNMENYTTYSYINHIIRWSNDGAINGMYSMFACQWSYEYIARNLRNVSTKFEFWFNFYRSEKYTSITEKYIKIFNRSQMNEEQKSIFLFGLMYELNYWNACYHKI
ncbi:MAG: TenA family protein [Ferroplasma sp.]